MDGFGEDLREEFRVKSLHERLHEESHVRHREPNPDFQEIKGAVSTKPNVENGGKRVTWPSLTQYLDGFGGELREPNVRRSARVIREVKKSDEEGAVAERAIHCRHSRSGHLGELRKNWNRVQELMKSPEVDVMTLEDSVRKYNEAFRKFMDAHEVCMEIEDDEERRELLVDSYETQRDMKWQLENLLNDWRAKKQRPRSPSESVFSRASSSHSIKEKTKSMEEARLKVNALKQKQDLDRQMQQIEKQKAELKKTVLPVLTSEFVAKSTHTQVPDALPSRHHNVPSVHTTCYYTSPQMASTPFNRPEKLSSPP